MAERLDAKPTKLTEKTPHHDCV